MVVGPDLILVVNDVAFRNVSVEVAPHHTMSAHPDAHSSETHPQAKIAVGGRVLSATGTREDGLEGIPLLDAMPPDSAAVINPKDSLIHKS